MYIDSCAYNYWPNYFTFQTETADGYKTHV